MGKIVAKFGGSSLSDAGQFAKVRQIIEMDARRCYVVPSAPGKRFDGDEKVTVYISLGPAPTPTPEPSPLPTPTPKASPKPRRTKIPEIVIPQPVVTPCPVG